MKKWIAEALYLIIIVVAIATVIFGFTFMRSHAGACLEQPFIYGARETAGDTFCSCYSTTETERMQFKFNETEFEMTRTDWSKPFG